MSNVSEKTSGNNATQVLPDVLTWPWAQFITYQKHMPKFNSEHEAIAVLKQDVDELWDSMRLDERDPNRKHQVKYGAIRVAATAMKFLRDCCDVN